MRSQKERETELEEKQMKNMSKAQQGLANLQQEIRYQQEQTQQLIQQQQQQQAKIQQQQMNAFLSVLSKFAEK